MDGEETVGNSMGRALRARWKHGRETVGNRLGRAPLGRSEMEVTTGWTEGKPWEIAWGELGFSGQIPPM